MGATSMSLGSGVESNWEKPRSAPYPIGLGVILVTVAMLFSAFVAALLVRRTGADWTGITLPPLVWFNTALLLVSSAAVERARRAVKRGAAPRAVQWLSAAAMLGILFLAGQITAWQELAARGLPLASGPHAAFFYLLSGTHGAHVLAGVVTLLWTRKRAAAGAYNVSRGGLNHAAIFWHFVGAVWLWLLAILATL
jgi:cytochrome c oxidase subunit III